MDAAKVALSIPADVLRPAKREVLAGRAKSLSSFVSEAVDEKLRRKELNAILDAMDAEHGKPNKAATAWARRILKTVVLIREHLSRSSAAMRRCVPFRARR